MKKAIIIGSAVVAACAAVVGILYLHGKKLEKESLFDFDDDEEEDLFADM